MRDHHASRRRLSVALLPHSLKDDGLRQRLAEHGIDTEPALRPDATIVDLRQPPLGTTVTSLINSGRREAATGACVYLVRSEQFGDRAIRSLAEADIVVPATRSYRPLITAIRRAVNDTDRAEEVSIRLRTMATLGLGNMPTAEATETPVALVLGPPGPRTLSLLADAAIRLPVRAALSRSQALQALESHAADALIVIAEGNRRPHAALIQLIRRHSDLSTAPIIVVEKQCTERHVIYWTESGADAVVTDTNLPVGLAICQRTARARGASRQWDRLLEQTVLTDFGEVSKMASSRYFEACLAQRQVQPTTPYALGIIRLDPFEGSDHHIALSEAAIYLALSARTTDLIARPSPDTFIVSMPGTDKARAASNMQAMAKMVGDLKFGGHDNSCTFTARYHHLHPKPGQTPAALITALLKGLSASRQHALLNA